MGTPGLMPRHYDTRGEKRGGTPERVNNFVITGRSDRRQSGQITRVSNPPTSRPHAA